MRNSLRVKKNENSATIIWVLIVIGRTVNSNTQDKEKQAARHSECDWRFDSTDRMHNARLRQVIEEGRLVTSAWPRFRIQGTGFLASHCPTMVRLEHAISSSGSARMRCSRHGL